MGSTRIRYNKRPDGLWQSAQTYAITNKEETLATDVFVQLDNMNHKFYIVDATDFKVYAEGGTTKNDNVLKIQAKKALKSLGAEFAAESRNR